MGAGPGGTRVEAGDGADEEALDEDDLEADDGAAEELCDHDDAEVGEGDDGAGAAEEIACIPFNGHLATPSAVWQAAQAQLRFQMVRGTYDNWIADTRCVSVEEDPAGADPGQTLVVQVANRYAAEWLELRLKRLILRTLQGLVGSPIGVRFQADEQKSAP